MVFLKKNVLFNNLWQLSLHTIIFYTPLFKLDKGEAKSDTQVIFKYSFETLNDRSTGLADDNWFNGVSKNNELFNNLWQFSLRSINFYTPWFKLDKGEAEGDKQVTSTYSIESLCDKLPQLIWLVDWWFFGVSIKNCSNRFIKI